MHFRLRAPYIQLPVINRTRHRTTQSKTRDFAASRSANAVAALISFAKAPEGFDGESLHQNSRAKSWLTRLPENLGSWYLVEQKFADPGKQPPLHKKAPILSETPNKGEDV
jgi:hypothetical protein